MGLDLLGNEGDVQTRECLFGKGGLHQGCFNVELMIGEEPKPMGDC